jgi:chemotaxis signal transduction protein
MVALAVDEVIGVKDFAALPVTEISPLLGEAAAEVISAVATLDAELLVLLRSAHWVPESVWQACSTKGIPG